MGTNVCIPKKDKITKKAIHPTAEAMGFLAFNLVKCNMGCI